MILGILVRLQVNLATENYIPSHPFLALFEFKKYIEGKNSNENSTIKKTLQSISIK